MVLQAEAQLQEDGRVEEGRAGWRRLRGRDDWRDWEAVFRALLLGRERAMREAGTSEPRGRGYNQAFSAWLNRNDFGDMKRTTRAACLNCAEHLDQINILRTEWLNRDDSDAVDALRVNHPQLVWQRFCRTTLDLPPRGSRRERGRETKVTLEVAVAGLKGGWDMGEIAAQYVQAFGVPDARELIGALATETQTRLIMITTPLEVADQLRQLDAGQLQAIRNSVYRMPIRPARKQARQTKRREA